MKKISIFIVLTLLFCLLYQYSPLLNKISILKRVSLGYSSSSLGEKSQAKKQLEPLISIEELLEDTSKEATEDLKKLVMREDVMGYLANLALVERDLDSETRADVFYRRALALHSTKEVRLKLASWLVDNGKEEEAIEEYLLLLPDREALEALDQLQAPSMEVARALIKSNHRQRTIDYIYEILDEESLSLCNERELIVALGRSYAQLGQHREALPYLRKIYEEGDEEIALWYARSLESTGAISEAFSIYEEMGASGAHALGNILHREGKKEEAAKILAKSTNPIGLWQSAILWEELSKTHKSLEIYLYLAEGESRYRDDAAYRAYVLLEREGLEGTEEMLEVLKEYPSWAVRLTGEANWELEPDPEIEVPSFLSSVEALEERGYDDWAEIELAIGQKNLELPEMLALSKWYLHRGEYYLSTVWGIRSLNVMETMKGYLSAYPRPYKEIVLETAEKYGVDPHLIWAKMREESHFRPQVVSAAGALGLMQLMPSTGQEMAGRLGMGITNLHLLQPEINILLGVFYLRQMLNMFDHDLDRALAAYNGGPGNVQRWSRSPLGTTPSDFPTAITFMETRNHLTKVLDTYHTYNWLYGQIGE